MDSNIHRLVNPASISYLEVSKGGVEKINWRQSNRKQKEIEK